MGPLISCLLGARPQWVYHMIDRFWKAAILSPMQMGKMRLREFAEGSQIWISLHRVFTARPMKCGYAYSPSCFPPHPFNSLFIKRIKSVEHDFIQQERHTFRSWRDGNHHQNAVEGKPALKKDGKRLPRLV
jgi:hypothetical protein